VVESPLMSKDDLATMILNHVATELSSRKVC